MKTFCFALAAIGMSMSLAAPAATAPAPSPAEPSISISQIEPERFELVYSGTKFTSRDQIERDLLLSAARLALAHNAQSFVLLAMPGEQPDVHPIRRSAGFGAKYGHWQPHWNYLPPQHGWQPWHPEWGAEFWTKDVDPKKVRRFQAHAIIQLGKSASPLDEELQFNAAEVVRDLSRPSPLAVEHPNH